jgi:outer membrane lipoprotein-sorting protein
MRSIAVFLSAAALYAAAIDSAPAAADSIPSAATIVSKAIDSDPWGMGGVEATARAVVHDPNGKKRELAFDATSRRTTGSLSKSLLRFKSPADVSGMKFLQVQKNEEDDDRYLYVPELKRTRRIASGTRSEAFMGTVYTYADVDRRDLRAAKATMRPEETIGKYACWHVEATPQNADAQYGKIEIWSRKDNLVPLKMVMYSKSGTAAKTLVTKELQRLKGRWHITRSVMIDHSTGKTTEILLEKVEPRDDVQSEFFTVANLEKN